MTEPSLLLRRARTEAGLSARALALLAETSVSTVTRIEAGKVDPTCGMLRKLLFAAGEDLIFEHRPRSNETSSLVDLTDAWGSVAGEERPNWTRLRTFIDYLTLHPAQVRLAIKSRPHPSGSKLMDVLLAAIAEKLADDHQLARPSWTRSVAPLADLWQSPGTPRMQASTLARTPPQFLERRLAISIESLWRDRDSIGV